MGDKKRGLYGKYAVQRTDGSSARGRKHAACHYFVLDLTHDPHALPALQAYIDSCESDYPRLAKDLRNRIKLWENGQRLAREAEAEIRRAEAEG